MLLYRNGPEQDHAQYCVHVVATMSPVWQDMQAANRVAVSVAKEVLLCQVVRPVGLSHAQVAACLAHIDNLVVHEVRTLYGVAVQTPSPTDTSPLHCCCSTLYGVVCGWTQCEMCLGSHPRRRGAAAHAPHGSGSERRS